MTKQQKKPTKQQEKPLVIIFNDISDVDFRLFRRLFCMRKVV
jgi:hypothetical protein